jgi:hypothetical protein
LTDESVRAIGGSPAATGDGDDRLGQLHHRHVLVAEM